MIQTNEGEHILSNEENSLLIIICALTRRLGGAVDLSNEEMDEITNYRLVYAQSPEQHALLLRTVKVPDSSGVGSIH
jgi:hypothetical protein